jgi:hypothetical protein
MQVRGSRKDVQAAFRKLSELEADALPAVPAIAAIVQREYDLARAYNPPPAPPKNAPKPKSSPQLDNALASVEVVVGGLAAIKKIAPEDPALITLLVKLSQPLPNKVALSTSKEGVTDRISARALEMIPPVALAYPTQAEPLVAALIDALDEPTVRMRALLSLREIGRPAKAAVAKIRALKFDPTKSVRDAAIAALAEIEPG